MDSLHCNDQNITPKYNQEKSLRVRNIILLTLQFPKGHIICNYKIPLILEAPGVLPKI